MSRFVERVSRNLGEKLHTGEVFLDAAKAFYTIRVDGLAYKLMALNFSSYLVNTVQCHLHVGWRDTGVINAFPFLPVFQ
jgi:hypothetical protein